MLKVNQVRKVRQVESLPAGKAGPSNQKFISLFKRYTLQVKRFAKSSFTLLEMLIVIGIISVIITIAAVTYSTSQKKARDSRRKGDLKAIQSAFEQYYSVCNYGYPVSADGFVPTIGCLSPSTLLLPTVPVDPKSGTPYLIQTSTSSDYEICTELDSETGTDYCVNNQQ